MTTSQDRGKAVDACLMAVLQAVRDFFEGTASLSVGQLRIKFNSAPKKQKEETQ